MIREGIDIRMAFSTLRTLGKIHKINSQRMVNEVSVIIKNVNRNLKQDFLFMISADGVVFLRLLKPFKVENEWFFPKLYENVNNLLSCME